MEIRLNGKTLRVETNGSDILEVWIKIFEIFAKESGNQDSLILLYHTALFTSENEFIEWCLQSTGASPPLYWVNRSYDLLKSFWAWVEPKGQLKVEFSAE